MNRIPDFRLLSLSCLFWSVIGCNAQTAGSQPPTEAADAAKTVSQPSTEGADAAKTASQPSTQAADALRSVEYHKGDIVTFGHYEQDNNPANGKEPITWIVLDRNDKGQVLLLSEKVLDGQTYNDVARVDLKSPRPGFAPMGGYKDGDTTIVISGRSLHDDGSPCNWEISTIRSWLNGYDASHNYVKNDYTTENFVDAAFTAEEKARIVPSSVPAHTNPSYPNHSAGNATTDQLFLLSFVEFKTYFKGSFARAEVTNYALKRGVSIQDGSRVPSGICPNEHCYARWWLRSPGSFDDSATSVDGVGMAGDAGHGCGYLDIGVRPALWLNP